MATVNRFDPHYRHHKSRALIRLGNVLLKCKIKRNMEEFDMSMRKIGSYSCLLVALAAVIFALFFKNMSGGRGWFVGLALFRTVQSGGFMGFIGNIFGVIITFAGFAWAGVCGLKDNDKNALISSATMLAVCAVSILFAIFSNGVAFTFGDLLIAVPPALILLDLLRSH